MKNKPDGLFFNRQFCAEAQNCCDRRGEITCVISPRGLSVKRFGMEVRMEKDRMLEVKGIRKSFGSLEVLKGVDLTVNRGDVIAIVGPSGSGKTTLLRCINFLEMADAGTMTFDGQLYRFGHVTRREMAGLRRRTGFVFQNYNLFANKTALQNVTEGLIVARKIPKSRAEQTGREALDKVGLSDRYDYYPSQLSGGQQQRAALARAIVTEPKVLLLDEPLSAIDALLRKSLQMEIRRIQRETDITAIFVTHDQNEAMVMSDMIHLLYDGKIEQSAEPAQMYARPATKFVASFIGSYNIISSEEFQKMTGTKAESETIAFRPESVKLSEERPDETDSYVFRGKIVDGIPQGNVYRYGIGCEGVRIHADVLFQETGLLRDFTECWLSIRKEDCILL